MDSIKNDPLLENYLTFQALFRGEISRETDFITIKSEKKECNFTIPFSGKGLPLISTLLVPAELTYPITDKWTPSGSLTFMRLGKFIVEQTKFPNKDDWQLSSGNNAKLIHDYSLAQSAGFLESSELVSSWGPFLKSSNEKNLGNRSVSFYVVSHNLVPVAGAFVVHTEYCAGIYGVATHPQFRKRGLAALILEKIHQEFKESPAITLQVESNSYAHSYYKNLNFTDAFHLLRLKLKE